MQPSHLQFIFRRVVRLLRPTLFLCALFSLPVSPFSAELLIDSKFHHLGDSTINDWTDTTAQPEGTQLEITFQSSAFPGETTLRFSQKDVHDAGWHIQINGTEITHLVPHEPRKTVHVAIPPNTIKAGANTLRVTPSELKDDIAIGEFRLFDKPLAEHLNLVTVTVEVADAVDTSPLPARITLADLQNKHVELYNVSGGPVALRAGTIYSRGEPIQFSLPAGEYLLYATRGFEWSRTRERITLRPGEPLIRQLKLRREVLTPGFISCDTHIHTYTYSGHGDSTMDERVLSIAGEGIELAVATDHNHHTDYHSHQEKHSLQKFFTPVVGNEVTTDNGHFNAFPLAGNTPIPNYKETNWVRLMDDIRSKGAKVIILNHPRWPELGTGPLGVFGMNRGSGERSAGPERFGFDGMELANSTSLLSDPLYLFHDWFALLNYGEKITAVGSSDSHTVGDPVGQGRTYIRSKTDDPAKLDIDELCEAFAKGQTTVSMGILAEAIVNQRYSMGDTLPVNDQKIDLALRVAAPGWVLPRRALVFLNGTLVAEREVPATVGIATDATLLFKLAPPKHDSYLVCVVLGEGVKEASWTTYMDYTLAATNPIYLDADRNGSFSSPRDSARKLWDASDKSIATLEKLVRQSDNGIAVQLLALSRSSFSDSQSQAFDGLVSQLAKTNQAIQLYQAPPPR
ncbi:MAG: CehA/McbA family metallohydrolase [Verrucomicrobiota bacterium]|nr:CehA/McbA family metallohydrolase [Verrucomicrobiota bacterium]